VNKYIEKVFNDFIPDNKGYIYIGTENVYIPIYRITLSITKRKQTSLNLVEEMVLRIANCGITDLDEISGILGLNRDILDITIGDLYIKSLAYPSSNKCYLMAEGRVVLKNLKTIAKETDTIRNIYVNALNQDIFVEKDSNFINQCSDNDCKVRHTFEGNNIEFYRNRVGTIREIFNKENEIYTQNSNQINQIPDELISIDEVEDINVCFIKLPILIYVSETGTDLDLMTSENKLRYLLDSIKGDILDQIRKHKLLKKVLTKFVVKYIAVPEGEFEDTDELKILIKKYVTDKANQGCYYDLIAKKVYNDRILIDDELEKLYELCLQDSGSVEIAFYIDNLDYWSKNSKFINLLTLIPRKTKYVIYYDNVFQKNLAETRIKYAIPEISKSDIKQYNHKDWFRIVFDKFQIIGCPRNYNVIDTHTRIIKSQYYLRNSI